MVATSRPTVVTERPPTRQNRVFFVRSPLGFLNENDDDEEVGMLSLNVSLIEVEVCSKSWCVSKMKLK